MKRNRRRAIWLIAAAALITLIAVLLAGMAAFARKEMLHEGLTQSQWYEGATRSARRWRCSAELAALTAAVLWLAVVPRVHRAAKRRKLVSPNTIEEKPPLKKSDA